MKNQELKTNRYYKQMVKERFYCTVPYWLATKYDLSMTEMVLFSIIYHYTSRTTLKCFAGSIERLCTYTNSTKPTVRTALENLYNKGFIYKQIQRFTDKRTELEKNWVTYSSVIDFNNKDLSIEDQIGSAVARIEIGLNNLEKLERRKKVKKC